MGNAARLSQHFLKDEATVSAIVAAAYPAPGMPVLEIGPGRGVLTRPLLDSGVSLTAVELDDRLARDLSDLLAPRGLKLIHADFLQLDLARLSGGPYTVVANLPYAVGAPILQKLLPWEGWAAAVLMFQKEVALRLCAEPGSADFGLLTLSTQLWAETEFLLEVPGSCFRPPPKVASGVVRLRRRARPLLPPEKHAGFFRVAKSAFEHRRKMAAGTLAKALGRERTEIEAFLAERGVGAQARPENIPVRVWLDLSTLAK